MYSEQEEAYQEQPQGQQYSAQAGSNAAAPTSANIVTGGTPVEPPVQTEAPNFQAVPPSPPTRQGLFFPPPAAQPFRLGGEAPDLSALLMRQMLQPAPSPQVNVWDALQAFSAGVQGQPPQYLQRHALEQEQQERRFKNLAGVMELQQRREQQDATRREKQLETYLKLNDVPKEFHTLSLDAQNKVRPWYESKVRTMAMHAGVELPDTMIQAAFDNKDTADYFNSLLKSAHYTPEERQEHFTYLSRLSDPKEIRAYVKDVEDRKVRDLASLIDERFSGWVTDYRKQKGLAVDTPIPIDEVKEHLGTLFPGLRDDALSRRAFQTAAGNKTRLAELGVVSGEAAYSALETTLKRRAEGPKLPPMVESFLASMYTGKDGKPLLPMDASSAQIKAATDAAAAFEIKKSADAGLSVEKYKMNLPAAAEERDKHVSLTGLLNGQIVKPQPGITVGELRTGDWRHATPTQLKAIEAIRPQTMAFNNMNALAGRLITANTWQEAIAQGIQLTVAAKSGANPTAKAYADAVEATTSYLARMVETGVMTNEDVARWRNAATASFFSTKQSREIQIALMSDIMKTAQQAALAQVAGVPLEEPNKLQTLLKRLDESTAVEQTVQKARTLIEKNPGRVIAVDPTGQNSPREISPGMSHPKGWLIIR